LLAAALIALALPTFSYAQSGKTCCNPLDSNYPYQLFADQGTALELRALTVDQKYRFAIEAFNERGVSRLSESVPID
jgi:hypothetical protein